MLTILNTIAVDDYPAQARKELLEWIKHGLVVERDGELSATDPLLRTLEFVDGLDQRIMTSSVSDIVDREGKKYASAFLQWRCLPPR